MSGTACLLVALVTSITPEARQALFARLKPSVVVIEVVQGSNRLGNGTGFVVREDGVVVTNHHVVDGHRSFVAVLSDGRRVDVTGVLLLDEAHDLAVLQIDARGLVPLSLGTSKQLTEGAQVFMAGNPLGLDFTFNEGVVTALRPTGLPSDLRGALTEPDKQPLLQLAINAEPGSSGSPVVDANGSVVGVVRSKMGSANFAIPVETLSAQLTPDVLARSARPVVPFPWWNVVISIVVLALVGLFLSGRLRRGGGGTPRAQRRFGGYEE